MSEVFADTFFFLALANPNDGAHERVLPAYEDSLGRLVTTEYVLVEVGDGLSRKAHRSYFLDLVDLLENQPGAMVVPAAPALFRRGLALFRSRPDKDWPLTDCISFVVMRERGIDEALTADRHFEQAGMKALLR